MRSSSENRVTGALRQGARRVNGAPAILAGVFVANVVLAVPLAIALRGMIADHLGASRAADQAVSDVNIDWWEEFSAQAHGLGTTFRPAIIGFAAVLSNIDSVVDNERHYVAVTTAGIAYGVLWLFLAAGIIDRYARGRPTLASGFFGASGGFLLRFARLGVMAWATYAVLFSLVHRALLGDFYDWATRDLAVERTDVLIRLALYLVFGALLVACNVVFDYAKIRTVVEDRVSVIGALAAGVRFVGRVPAAACGLYAACAIVFLLVLAAYALAAPGAGGAAPGTWLAFALGQLFILARLWTKLLFLASETVLFQNELAHREYTAMPAAAGSDSPLIEAIANARTQR
jgi:hypothetical protein